MTFPVSPPTAKPLIWAYHYIDTNAVKETMQNWVVSAKKTKGS